MFRFVFSRGRRPSSRLCGNWKLSSNVSSFVILSTSAIDRKKPQLKSFPEHKVRFSFAKWFCSSFYQHVRIKWARDWFGPVFQNFTFCHVSPRVFKLVRSRWHFLKVADLRESDFEIEKNLARLENLVRAAFCRKFIFTIHDPTRPWRALSKFWRRQKCFFWRSFQAWATERFHMQDSWDVLWHMPHHLSQRNKKNLFRLSRTAHFRLK